jgi:hypothetical protein
MECSVSSNQLRKRRIELERGAYARKNFGWPNQPQDL